MTPPKQVVYQIKNCYLQSLQKWGVLHFVDAPLARTPTDYGPKCFVSVSYALKPSTVPNLKLLASVVGERNNCLDAPNPQPPPIFSLNIVSW